MAEGWRGQDFDPVTFLMAFDDGELTLADETNGFQQLIDRGLIAALEGRYQRVAMRLVRLGYCTYTDEEFPPEGFVSWRQYATWRVRTEWLDPMFEGIWEALYEASDGDLELLMGVTSASIDTAISESLKSGGETALNAYHLPRPVEADWQELAAYVASRWSDSSGGESR